MVGGSADRRYYLRLLFSVSRSHHGAAGVAGETAADLLGIEIGVGYHSGSHFSALQALEPFAKPGDVKLKFVGWTMRRLAWRWSAPFRPPTCSARRGTSWSSRASGRSSTLAS